MENQIALLRNPGGVLENLSNHDICQIEAQKSKAKELKKDKIPFQDCLKMVGDIKQVIPSLEELEEPLKKSYLSVLEDGHALEAFAVEGETNINQAETCFGRILMHINSLFEILKNDNPSDNHQGFDMNQIQFVLERIQERIIPLGKVISELEKLEQGLKMRAFDASKSQAMGEHYSESQIQEYLNVSSNESDREQKYEECVKELEKINKKIHDRELRADESEKIIKKIEEMKEKLLKRYDERESQVRDKEKILLNISERIEKLTDESLNQCGSMIKDLTSKHIEQEQIKKTKYDGKIDELDGMIADLNKKRDQCSTMYPLIHHIFVLDHSLSMKGTRWEAVLNALDAFVESNRSQVGDLLSVITFDDQASQLITKGNFSDYKAPESKRWGGTNFDSAFATAKDVSNLSRNHRPVVVFLTDGEGRMREADSILREMNTSHKDKGFMFFSIGVGEDYNRKSLQRITRTANDGSLFIEFGSEKIALLHEVQEVGILKKIFQEIFNAINALPIKIKTALEDLKKEKREVEEEEKLYYDSQNARTQQKCQEIEKVQEGLLEKKMKALKERKTEEQEQIDFLKAEMQSLMNETEALESRIHEERRSVGPEEIAALEEKKQILKDEKERAWEQKKHFSDDRDRALKNLQTSQSKNQMSISQQLFDFFKAKKQLESFKYLRRIYLGNLIGFIKDLVEEASKIDEGFKRTQIEVAKLTEDEIAEYIFQHHHEIVEIQKDPDTLIFRQIARKILEIKDSDTEDLEVLQLLTDCLHPRTFLDFRKSIEEKKVMIDEAINRKFASEIKQLEVEQKSYDQDWRSKNEKLEKIEKSLKESKKEIGQLDDDKIPEQKREIRKIKEAIKEAKVQADEANKENARSSNHTDWQDAEKDNENRLRSAEETLRSHEKSLEEEKSRYESLREGKKSLEIKLEETESKKAEIKKKILNKEDEKDDIKRKAFQYHQTLTIELKARAQGLVNIRREQSMKTFQKMVFQNLVVPIHEYVSTVR